MVEDGREHKVAIVTGAARGIGLATARWFLQRQWRVAIIDKDAPALNAARDQLEWEAPGRAIALPCDVSNPVQVEAMVAMVDTEWERIDALVNNAGVAVFKPLVQTSFEEWRHVMATNLDGAFLAPVRRLAWHNTQQQRLLGRDGLQAVFPHRGLDAVSAHEAIHFTIGQDQGRVSGVRTRGPLRPHHRGSDERLPAADEFRCPCR